MAIVRRLVERKTAYRRHPVVQMINSFVESPWCIGLLGALTVLAFAFSLEVAFYSFVVVYAMYVSIFCDDLKPLMPLFVLCYVTPSLGNNPGKDDQGLFYGASGIYLICIVSVGILTILARLITDEEIGRGTIFTKKRSLLLGMLLLGASYLLSGLLSEKYLEYVKSNIIFALIQFGSVFLLYFIFTAAIKWDKFDVDYFACFGMVMGLVVAAEVGIIYLTEDVIVNGAIIRGRIYSGWGCYNNIGAIISMSIPFAFHFACKKKVGPVFMLVGCLLLAGVIFSCSRGSIVGGAFAFAVSFIYTFFKAENKIAIRITSIALAVLAGVAAIFFLDDAIALFNDVPNISDVTDGSLSFNDSGRFDIYISGLKVYLDNPIFGQTFYPASFPMYDFSTVDSFSAFFPPRWHNTVVQLLASCGIVGFSAYLFHRYQTLRLLLRSRGKEIVFIACSVAVLLATSMFDCHLFNVGPALFYSMALAFGENTAKCVKGIN